MPKMWNRGSPSPYGTMYYVIVQSNVCLFDYLFCQGIKKAKLMKPKDTRSIPVKFNSTQLNLTQPSWPNLTQHIPSWYILNSMKPNTTWPNSTLLNLTQLSSNKANATKVNSTQPSHQLNQSEPNSPPQPSLT